MRAMVATVTLSGVLAAGLATTAITTATAQDADEGAEPTGVSDGDLVDRLIDIERGLPALPPSNVTLDPDETFGQLEGDFLGAETELGLVSDQARQLFIDADEADGEVAEAVAIVARGYLRLEQAYGYLARYESHDLARPVGATDGDDIATGADTAAGLAEAGLDLVHLARMDALLGYGVLRDATAADDAEKALLDQAYGDTQRYLTTIRPQAHTLVSASSTAVLFAVERFETDVPSEARAKDVTYVCVPRHQYPYDSPSPVVAVAALLASGELDLVPTADCPDLPSADNVVGSQGSTGTDDAAADTDDDAADTGDVDDEADTDADVDVEVDVDTGTDVDTETDTDESE